MHVVDVVKVLPCTCSINQQSIYCEESRDACDGYCYPGVSCETDQTREPTCGECPQHYEYITVYDGQHICRGKMNILWKGIH